MNDQAKSALTVLASSLVFGLAGLWLSPKEPKAAAVGALAGATGAIGYIQQNSRLRQLAAQQRRPSNIASSSPQNQTARQIARTAKNLEIITKTTADYGTKISEIERILRHQAGQANLSQNELNSLRKRLEAIESQGGRTLAGEDRASTHLQPIEQKLEALETEDSSHYI
jgi:tRNA C32,U32 (ribose-2'-O)-methylase TrmJ